jgi:hypothetical protein
MYVVGGEHLESGAECKILTGIDDHSRYMICVFLCKSIRY